MRVRVLRWRAVTEGGWLASGPLFGLPLADLWFALLFFILGTFLFLDGFDFGVGVLFATRKDDEARETLLAAIGPFWDGNEVWLVVFGGAGGQHACPIARMLGLRPVVFDRFAGVLSDAEIRLILDYIKSTWPERERTYQAERTRADMEAAR
jgi:hypothetical protein